MRALPKSSTRVSQTTVPAAASSARTTARWSATIATRRAAAPVPISVNAIAARTPGARVEVPMHAAGSRVERIDLAGLAAEVHAPARDRRRAVDSVVAGQAERPPYGEPRQLRGREPGPGIALKARIARRDAPPLPSRFAEIDLRVALRAHRGRRGIHLDPRRERLAGQVLRDRTTVVARQRDRHRDHRAVLEREQDLLGRHRRKRSASRGARHARVVAHGASILIRRCAGRRRRRFLRADAARE